MKKKILRIITRLNIGGPSIHTVLLTTRINPQKFVSYLISGKVEAHESDMSYFAEKYNVKPIYINSMSREIRLIQDLKSLREIIKIIKKIKPDIVHTHTAKAGMLGRVAAKLMGVPIIIHTFHGNVFKGYFNKTKTVFFIFLEKLLGRISTKIIAISKQQKLELISLGIAPSDKIKMVNLGFDFENVIPSKEDKGVFRKEFDFPQNDILIGIIGRLVPIKNHYLFLDIAEKLLKKYDNLFFPIIGNGELRACLQNEINQRDLSKNVIITGFVKNLKPVYADLDFVLLTSNNEGTPVAIIEAMACRKIIMTTNVGGVDDFVENGVNGFYFPRGNSKLFIQKIEYLLKNNNTEKIKEKASKTAFKKFNFTRLIHNIESLYIRLWDYK